MSELVVSGTRQIANDYKPALTNLVSKVSMPVSSSVALNTVGEGTLPVAKAGMSLFDATKNGVSGIPKEKFDVVFNTVKRTSKQNLKKSANIAVIGTAAGKTGGKRFGKIYANTFKRVKISGKMKVVAIAVALGIASYLYFKD